VKGDRSRKRSILDYVLLKLKIIIAVVDIDVFGYQWYKSRGSLVGRHNVRKKIIQDNVAGKETILLALV
jgi:hypothetical protein